MSVREVGARLVLDIKDAKARLNELERQIKAIEKAKIQFAANTAELDRLENRLKEIKKERDSLMKQRLAMQVDLDNLANLRNKLADIKEDISKAERLLGYSPEWSFEKGIHEAINWYVENLKEQVM